MSAGGSQIASAGHAGRAPSAGQGGMAGTGAQPTRQPTTVPIEWGRIWRLAWKLFAVARPLIVLYLVFSLAEGLAGMFAAQFLGEVTSHLQLAARGNPVMESSQSEPQQQPSQSAENRASATAGVFWSYLIWVLLALAALLLAVPVKWFATKMDLLMSNHLRSGLFTRVLGQSPEFFHQYSAGDLTTILNSMTVETQMTLRQIFVDPVLQLALLLATTGQVIYNFNRLSGDIDVFGWRVPSAWIPLAIVVVALFFPYLIGQLGKALQNVGRKVQATILGLSSLVTSAMLSPEEIQVMRAEPIFAEKYDRFLAESLEARLHQQTTVGAINIVNQLPTLIVQISLLGLGLWLALQGNSSAPIGNLIAILGLAPLLMAPINSLSGCLVMLFQSWPSIERVESVMNQPRSADERPGHLSPEQVEPTLEARALTFRYRPGANPVFSGLTFTAPPRQRTGFVAKMGEGKTTFFKLALRFYDPSQGEILLGGNPTTDFTFESIRQHIVMMSQFPAFFDDTLHENMRLAKPDATDVEIQELCERTGIWRILSSNRPPITLDTNLAAGRLLSGGQKKLLALTRCLLRNPAVLLLDEPTVGMDNEEKFELIDVLRHATAGKTVLVVDHDINWLLQFCDYFVVMDKGTVVETGTAQELLSKRGLLYHLFTVTQGPRIGELARYLAAAE